MDAEAFDHTPLPWFIRDGQVWAPEGMIAQLQQRGGLLEVVAGDHVEYHLPEMEANGEFIVKAVNSHSRLVEALEMARVIVAEVLEVEGGGNGSVPTTTQMALAAIDAAMAAARGEGE